MKSMKIACVSMKDAGKIMDVSSEVVRAYVKQGDLQWIPVGSYKMIPLYEIASLRDITLQAALDLTRFFGAVMSYIWIKPCARSSIG